MSFERREICGFNCINGKDWAAVWRKVGGPQKVLIQGCLINSGTINDFP